MCMCAPRHDNKRSCNHCKYVFVQAIEGPQACCLHRQVGACVPGSLLDVVHLLHSHLLQRGCQEAHHALPHHSQAACARRLERHRGNRTQVWGVAGSTARLVPWLRAVCGSLTMALSGNRTQVWGAAGSTAHLVPWLGAAPDGSEVLRYTDDGARHP